MPGNVLPGGAIHSPLQRRVEDLDVALRDREKPVRDLAQENPELLELDESFMARSFGEEIDKVELLKRLHNLPEASREILYLRIYGNLSFRQIGEVLSVSENAARVQYYRAREKLRKELEEDGA